MGSAEILMAARRVSVLVCDEYDDERLRAFWKAAVARDRGRDVPDAVDEAVRMPAPLEPATPAKPRPVARAR